MTSVAAVPADLAELALFTDARSDELAGLAARLVPITVAAGGVLMQEGAVGESFVLVTRGDAVVRRTARVGDGEIGRVGPGSVVGELALLRDSPRAATVIASSLLVGYSGDAKAFADLLDVPGVNDRLAHTVRQRLASGVRPVDVGLRDGTRLQVRPILPTDRERLIETGARISPESFYQRFFRHGQLSERTMTYLLDIDYVHNFAWLAIALAEPGHPVIGSARYVRLHDDPATAEIALTVIDEYHGRGLGGLLLGALAAAAGENEVERLLAFVLADNAPMRALLDRVGAKWRREDQGVLSTVLGPSALASYLPDAMTTSALKAAVRDIVDAAGLALV